MPCTHTTPIFILRHKVPDFEGVMLGVDFCNGRGSTSSVQEAATLMAHGCTIEDNNMRTIVESYTTDKKAERSQIAAELKSMEAIENNAGNPWSKEAQEAREVRQREGEELMRFKHKSARWKHAHNYPTGVK